MEHLHSLVLLRLLLSFDFGLGRGCDGAGCSQDVIESIFVGQNIQFVKRYLPQWELVVVDFLEGQHLVPRHSFEQKQVQLIFVLIIDIGA